MRSSLAELLATGRPLLADGATGTNYFQMGLSSGEPPEFWNEQYPERVRGLHQEFVDAGADIILTNTFGGNASRLKLHNAQARTREINARAARLAREVADTAPRPVVVAGSVGPTGELFEPMGALTHDVAVAYFTEQIEGLKEGGADVIWIETMSAIDEVRAAATAAIAVGMPYTATCSFDTAGRTMMGLLPNALGEVFEGLAEAPLAYGANCGVGASDILVTICSMSEANPEATIIAKGNCGVPRFQGTEIVYSGTPELMGDYARLGVLAGARIIGGCCGTSADHLRLMRTAIDNDPVGDRPSVDLIVSCTGPLVNAEPGTTGGAVRERRRARRDTD